MSSVTALRAQTQEHPIARFGQYGVSRDYSRGFDSLRSLDGRIFDASMVEGIAELCKSVAGQNGKLLIIASRQPELGGVRLLAVEPRKLADVEKWISCPVPAGRRDERPYVAVLGFDCRAQWSIGERSDSERETEDRAPALELSFPEATDKFFTDAWALFSARDVIFAAFPRVKDMDSEEAGKSPGWPYF